MSEKLSEFSDFINTSNSLVMLVKKRDFYFLVTKLSCLKIIGYLYKQIIYSWKNESLFCVIFVLVCCIHLLHD